MQPALPQDLLAEARDLGVRVKMLTGDAVAIAIETCKQLSLGTNVYDSQRLITGNMAGSDVCLDSRFLDVRFHVIAIDP